MNKRRLIKFAVSFTALFSLLTLGALAASQQNQGISITSNGVQFTSGSANTLQILFYITIIALAPSILIMMTSFTRIVIVLSFLRNALGLQQTPPNQVLVGIALFLTLFIMSPTIDTINKTAYQPLAAGTITTQQAYSKAMAPLRTFMFKQTEASSLNTFVSMAGMSKPKSLNDIPSRVLIPAFIISELKRAFMMGFIIYLPFLVIDLIVSSTLMSMGMIMLPPMMISLPLKLALFVLVDGWGLVVQSMVHSFN
ncbi:MAG: flagellar type III secretion system pore protein FliP [Clostridia bacterium]|nr:flagellar type III secretion system pore protein FliP [Clostridia bacterium]